MGRKAVDVIGLAESSVASLTHGVFTPDQFFAVFKGSAGSLTMPERRLWLAVLIDAILTATRTAPRKRAARESAVHWLLLDEHYTANDLGSYRWVCDVTGLEADYLRRGLRRYLAGGTVSSQALGRTRRTMRPNRVVTPRPRPDEPTAAAPVAAADPAPEA